MDPLTTWLFNNLGSSPAEFLITFICAGCFCSFAHITLVDNEISYLADKFSPEFRKTLNWVFAICFILVIYQGAILDAKAEISRNVYGGIGYLIGSFIALLITPVLLTYFIRLFFPLFKWIHDKTQ